MNRVKGFIKKTSSINIIKIILGLVILTYVLWSTLLDLLDATSIYKNYNFFWTGLVLHIPLIFVTYLLLHSGFKKPDNKKAATVSESNFANIESKEPLDVRLSHSPFFYSIVCCLPTFLIVTRSDFSQFGLMSLFPLCFIGFIVLLQGPLTIASLLLKNKKGYGIVNVLLKVCGAILLIVSGLFLFIFLR